MVPESSKDQGFSGTISVEGQKREGRTDSGGGMAASALDGSRLGELAQRGRGEGAGGGALAAGDDHDVKRDSRADANGELDAGVELPGSNPKSMNRSVKRTDTFPFLTVAIRAREAGAVRGRHCWRHSSFAG